MSRYRTYGATDDVPMTDGDVEFLRLNSRVQGHVLPPGTVSWSANMRLNRTTAKVRAGLESISSDLSLNNPPLVLDFSLGADVAVSSITRSGGTATVTTGAAHGYTTGDLVNIRGAVQTDYNGDYEITVTGGTTFTYTVVGSPATPATGTIFANKGPVIFSTYEDVVRCSTVFATNDNANTEYIIVASTDQAYALRGGVAPQTIAYPAGETVDATDDASMAYWNGNVYIFRGYQTANPGDVTSLTSAAGTATLTATANHGLTTGDWVWIEGASPVNYNGSFQVTVTGATTFTYAVAGGPASPATGTITFRPCKIPLVWNGDFADDFELVPNGAGSTTFIKMPPCAWGVDFKGRLVLPYARDELILSDVYNANSYDTIYNELRIRGGTNDWLVAVHPYQNAQLLVFYRKSIHLVDLSQDDLSIIGVTEVTRDIGCAARRSVVTCGDRVFWLSDRGVQSLVIGDLLSLRQAADPLSDAIDDVIQDINWTYVDDVVAAYWNNRYYLAIPYQNSTTANRILVYNFLNKGWESVDSYPEAFNVENFHIMDYNGAERLHVTTTFGFAYAMEVNEADDWGNDDMPVTIPGALDTRQYAAGDFTPKRFRRFTIDANLTAGDSFTLATETENPDYTTSTQTFTATATGDILYRIPYVGLTGTCLKAQFRTLAGRPEIMSVRAEYQGVTFRGNYNQS